MNHYDVIIVGAGLSGIGAAYYLQQQCPAGPTPSSKVASDRRHLGPVPLSRHPLRQRHAHPRLRLQTLDGRQGHRRRPVDSQLRERDGDENGIREHIRFNHKVRSAAWSTEDASWTVTAERRTRRAVQLTCNFLYHVRRLLQLRRSLTTRNSTASRLRGHVVHPQFWPEDLDYAGKQVVVIGSGATAMTLVPAMAETARRSPCCSAPPPTSSRARTGRIANTLRKFLPEKLAYAITRFKNVRCSDYIYRRPRTTPEKVKERCWMVAQGARPDYDVEKHFTPSYNPWDQRLCLIPNDDLYRRHQRSAARGGDRHHRVLHRTRASSSHPERSSKRTSSSPPPD